MTRTITPAKLDRLWGLCNSRRQVMKDASSVRLELFSVFEALEFVQVVADRIGEMAGFDEDGMHWVGVSVRECVVNAIKHGNGEDPRKRVVVEFGFTPRIGPNEMYVRVLDEGEGFDPVEIADPLAPENILKSSGRGIFFMRSFMDDVSMRRAPQGGMEVHLVKKLPGHADSVLAETPDSAS
ncbi:MAG TPA: ATP-binding protein [Acidobacteria bacterium]|nr:ATP-binding protein [Acidobacteriota bacterium]